MIQRLRRVYNSAEIVSDAVSIFSCARLKVGSYHYLYYHFRYTPYTNKVTMAVKLFSSHLRRRKAQHRFQTWPEDRRYTVGSNDTIICDSVSWWFCPVLTCLLCLEVVFFFANSVTYHFNSCPLCLIFAASYAD